MDNRRSVFFANLAQTSPDPPAWEIVRGKGSYVFDKDGKQFIDLISGISVSNLGHRNTKIHEAIVKQSDEHLHLMVFGEYLIPIQTILAERLAGFLPPQLQSIYLTNSGAEATEGAMKLAKRYTGRSKFISFKNAYHGSTQGALSICGNEKLKNSFRPLLPCCQVIDYNSTDQLSFIDNDTAAVFAEVIQAESGIRQPDRNYLSALRKRCTETGTLLVYDEIQTGMGRTGSLFAFEQTGTVPDILLLGKAFGGGLPLGAFISSKEIMSVLMSNPVLGHMTTTGGHPLSCAAAIASLQIITEENLLQGVLEKEKQIISQLRHKRIKSIRGKGLFFAIEFDNEVINKKIIQRCFEKGILTDWFLFAPQCLRIAPPLIIEQEELERACNWIVEAIDEI